MRVVSVVSMVPSWTETLLACGVNVVGRTRFCIHPELAKQIPVVGGTKDISWEKLQALRPDLLLLDKEENPLSMAEQSPIPYFASHVQSVLDLPNELTRLADVFKDANATALLELQKRWQAQLRRPRQALTSWQNLPGVLEWLKLPEMPDPKFVYVIWKNPWMAAGGATFIGSMLNVVGLSGRQHFAIDKYPQFTLEELDPLKHVLLFSSEPYPFHKRRQELLQLPFASALVDGESFSWFGVRSLEFLERI